MSKSRLFFLMVTMVLCLLVLSQTVSAYAYRSPCIVVKDLGKARWLVYAFSALAVAQIVATVSSRRRGWQPKSLVLTVVLLSAIPFFLGIFLIVIGSTKLDLGLNLSSRSPSGRYCTHYLYDPAMLPLGIALLIVWLVALIAPVVFRKKVV